ncbi:hypothetical protein [Methylobacterium brachiatum]
MPRLEITGTQRHYCAVAAVEQDGAWRLFKPFREGRIRAAAFVGADRLVCLGKTGDLCLIDWRLGEERARGSIPERYATIAEIFVARNADLIVVHGDKRPFDPEEYCHSIAVLRADTLETILQGEGLLWSGNGSVARLVEDLVIPRKPGAPVNITIHSDLFEVPGGGVAFIGDRCDPDKTGYGLCQLNPVDGSVQYTPLPHEPRWWWLSPSGRLAVTLTAGAPAPSGESPAHRVEAGGGRAIELWTTVPPQLRKTLLRLAVPERDLRITAMVWEPDETAVWVQAIRYSAERTEPGTPWQKRDEQHEFQRIGLDGAHSPVFHFERFDGSRFTGPAYLHFNSPDILDVSPDQPIAIRAGWVGGAVFIPRAWCAEDRSARRISEDEDGFQPTAWAGPKSSAIQRFLAKACPRPVVVVAAFEQAAIADALQRLAQMIRTGLADLLQDDVLDLAFKVGGRTMTETAFFARLARERIAVVPELRALLTTYLDVQPEIVAAKKLYRQVWGPKENQGALAPAMQALLHLDPGAHDVFRRYLDRRDGEHETHSRDVILETYIAETGWRDAAMIRFGLYAAMTQYRDGVIILGGHLDTSGLVGAAEALLSPDAFAEAILDELDRFMELPDFDPPVPKAELYQGLTDGLRMSPYGQRVRAALAARRPFASR